MVKKAAPKTTKAAPKVAPKAASKPTPAAKAFFKQLGNLNKGKK